MSAIEKARAALDKHERHPFQYSPLVAMAPALRDLIADHERQGTPPTGAHEEAHRRYDGDTIVDDETGEPTSHDDWGYAECQRQAFVAGAGWAQPAPPTGDERQALARIIGNENPDNPMSWAAVEIYLPMADAALAAGFRRRGPVTDSKVDAALDAFVGLFPPRGNEHTQRDRERMRAAIEAASAVL